ncbi:His-Xaa-Ser system protein HxsD [Candidatus Gracilibacteria bacterium]|nr:His-Xaa-Ser system protein HxsD [Candidatus Gracilibacteria bacterium]
MEKFLTEVIEGNKFELLIDTKIFSKDIILKSAYNFLDKGYFFFKFNSEGNIIMQFTSISDSEKTPEEIIGLFSEELISVYLRDKLEKDNKVIRETIIEKAINGPLDVNNFVSLDTESIGDNTEKNQIDFDKDIDDILKEIENDPDLQIDEMEIENILKEIEEESKNESIQKPVISINKDGLNDIKNKFKNNN